MNSQVKWLLTTVLAGLIVAPALGQQRYRVDVIAMLLQQGADTPLLLSLPSVKKEIKLTDEQDAKFRQIIADVRGKPLAEIQKALQETRDKVNKAIPDILSAEQAKRLKQIELQINGVLSFNKPEVQKELKLTDKQKEEIKGIGDDLNKDIRQTMGDGDGAAVRKRLQALGKVPQLKKEAARKAVALLSDEQKKTWDKMTGDKFELRLDALRPGGRR